MEDKMEKVIALLGRVKLSKNEQWMFYNYWNNNDYDFQKDSRGKLSVHKI